MRRIRPGVFACESASDMAVRGGEVDSVGSGSRNEVGSESWGSSCARKPSGEGWMEVSVVNVSRSVRRGEFEVGLEPLEDRFMLAAAAVVAAPRMMSSEVSMRCLGRRANDEDGELDGDERERGIVVVADKDADVEVDGEGAAVGATTCALAVIVKVFVDAVGVVGWPTA